MKEYAPFDLTHLYNKRTMKALNKEVLALIEIGKSVCQLNKSRIPIKSKKVKCIKNNNCKCGCI